MEVQGKIKVIGEVETFGNDFTKRNLVITTDEQYPQMIQIEFVKDKCTLLDPLKVGDSVKVGVNLRGREWVNPEGVAKYFNSIQGWRIEKTTEPVGEIQVTAEEVKESDDLPF